MSEIPNIAACSQREIGLAFGISRQAVMQWTDCPRNPDKSYNLPSVIQWKIERERATGDPYMSGSDSPALEQYRAAKARLAELDLQERTRNLVDRAHTVKCMMEFGAVIRSCGADLERKHGAAARERLDQAIDAAVAAVKKMLGENEPNA